MSRSSISGLVFAAVFFAAVHGDAGAQAHENPAPAPAATPFPADIGGPFALSDHGGRAVTDADFRGRFLLVFFGYARCEAICPVGLKQMTEALDLLGEAGARVQPVLITVDPEHDRPEVLAARVAEIHPRLIGLTGPPGAVAAAKAAYKVESTPLAPSWKGTPRIAHGSFVYLMGPDGALLTVLPPVLGPARLAQILRGYLG